MICRKVPASREQWDSTRLYTSTAFIIRNLTSGNLRNIYASTFIHKICKLKLLFSRYDTVLYEFILWSWSLQFSSYNLFLSYHILFFFRSNCAFNESSGADLAFLFLVHHHGNSNYNTSSNLYWVNLHTPALFIIM